VLTAMATATAGWAIAQPSAGVDLAVRWSASSPQPVCALAGTLTSLVAGSAG